MPIASRSVLMKWSEVNYFVRIWRYWYFVGNVILHGQSLLIFVVNCLLWLAVFQRSAPSLSWITNVRVWPRVTFLNLDCFNLLFPISLACTTSLSLQEIESSLMSKHNQYYPLSMYSSHFINIRITKYFIMYILFIKT